MALTKPYTDEKTAASYPDAYWCVVEVILYPGTGAGILVQMYASEAARRAGKSPLPGVTEVWARNHVETVSKKVASLDKVNPAQAPKGAEGAKLIGDGWYRDVEVPHNDYDDWFGPAVLKREGIEPFGQAYAYLKTLPDWADAKDA